MTAKQIEIIKTKKTDLSFKLILNNEIIDRGILSGNLFKIEKLDESRILGTFTNQYLHSLTDNKIAIIVYDGKTLSTQRLGILDYDNMKLNLFSVDYFNQFEEFRDSVIKCRKVKYDMYGNGETIHFKWDTLSLKLTSIIDLNLSGISRKPNHDVPKLIHEDLISLFGKQKTDKILYRHGFNIKWISLIIFHENLIRLLGLTNFSVKSGLKLFAILLIVLFFILIYS